MNRTETIRTFLHDLSHLNDGICYFNDHFVSEEKRETSAAYSYAYSLSHEVLSVYQSASIVIRLLRESVLYDYQEELSDLNENLTHETERFDNLIVKRLTFIDSQIGKSYNWEAFSLFGGMDDEEKVANIIAILDGYHSRLYEEGRKLYAPLKSLLQTLVRLLVEMLSLKGLEENEWDDLWSTFKSNYRKSDFFDSSLQTYLCLVSNRINKKETIKECHQKEYERLTKTLLEDTTFGEIFSHSGLKGHKLAKGIYYKVKVLRQNMEISKIDDLANDFVGRVCMMDYLREQILVLEEEENNPLRKIWVKPSDEWQCGIIAGFIDLDKLKKGVLKMAKYVVDPSPGLPLYGQLISQQRYWYFFFLVFVKKNWIKKIRSKFAELIKNWYPGEQVGTEEDFKKLPSSIRINLNYEEWVTDDPRFNDIDPDDLIKYRFICSMIENEFTDEKYRKTEAHSL